VTAPTKLDAAPARLVVDGQQRFGRFGTAVAQANLIDARFRGLPRVLRRWRLKEWQAVQIASPGVFASFALFDVKLMSLMQAKVYERARGEKIVHEWKLRPGAFRLADQLLDSTNAYQDRRGAMSFGNRLARGRVFLELDLAQTRDLPRVAGRIELLCDRGASQVVSLPFDGPGGMYSHKGMFPIEGTLAVGGSTYTFRPGDSLALLDDHKGYYPYVMRWDWVTSATFAEGEALGFNLTRNQCREPDTYNENCAWRGERLGILPAVEFTRERPREPGESWRIRDRAGRVDLTFTPTVPGDVRVNAIVVESRYRGPFGTFTGRLEPDGLDPIVVDGWFGMGEDFHLRC
jgi:Domain of unknown function (DUF2804), C-terminal/Domain of unknown function (DUF2804), N-terminal